MAEEPEAYLMLMGSQKSNLKHSKERLSMQGRERFEITGDEVGQMPAGIVEDQSQETTVEKTEDENDSE